MRSSAFFEVEAEVHVKTPSFPGRRLASIALALAASTALAQTQTPWRTNANGTYNTAGAKGFNEGYQFTPNASGRVTQLCGNHSGAATIRLYNRSTNTQIASAAVTSSYTWVCVTITSVAVAAGTSYTVTDDMVPNGTESYWN